MSIQSAYIGCSFHNFFVKLNQYLLSIVSKLVSHFAQEEKSPKRGERGWTKYLAPTLRLIRTNTIILFLSQTPSFSFTSPSLSIFKVQFIWSIKEFLFHRRCTNLNSRYFFVRVFGHQLKESKREFTGEESFVSLGATLWICYRALRGVVEAILKSWYKSKRFRSFQQCYELFPFQIWELIFFRALGTVRHLSTKYGLNHGYELRWNTTGTSLSIVW